MQYDSMQYDSMQYDSTQYDSIVRIGRPSPEASV